MSAPMNRRLLIVFVLSILVLSFTILQAEPVNKNVVSEQGYVTGKILSENKSLVFGYIGFFLTSGRMPDPTRFWRTPDYISPIKEDGEFDARVPEGNYYVIAIKKLKKELGPPESGDHFFYFMDCKGPMVIEVKKGIKLELGTQNTVPAAFVSELGGITAVEGNIQDEEGKKVSGIYIGAYDKPVMLGKVNYVSQKSDKDGRYELRLPEGGNYYIVARSRLGGPPVSGDYYARVCEDNKPITIKTGETLKMNIKVYKVK